jgi:superoxide dismutase, Cu-Zn family
VTTLSALRVTAVGGVCLVAVCVTGVAAAGAATPRGTSQSTKAATSNLAVAGRGSAAVTYDQAVAPAGAQVAAALTTDGGTDTTVTLDVEGLLPDRGYAAHAHVAPCGATGADAGPHFQNTVDPAATPDAPSTDPAYANPENEVWLDLRTDAGGDGSAETTVPFRFTQDRSPRSIVIHGAELTATHAGHAGTAGDRVACITIPG